MGHVRHRPCRGLFGTTEMAAKPQRWWKQLLDIGLPQQHKAPRPHVHSPDKQEEKGHKNSLLDLKRSNKPQGTEAPLSLAVQGQHCTQGCICKRSSCRTARYDTYGKDQGQSCRQRDHLLLETEISHFFWFQCPAIQRGGLKPALPQATSCISSTLLSNITLRYLRLQSLAESDGD